MGRKGQKGGQKSKKTDTQQRSGQNAGKRLVTLDALLLHMAGERVRDIYDTFAAEEDKFADVKQKLGTYFALKKNVQYQVYMF